MNILINAVIATAKELIDIWFIIGFVLLTSIFAINGHCKLYPVEVVSVYDGDTLRLKFENEFEFDARLHGLDAPELSQNLGQLCKTKLETMIAGTNLKAHLIAEDIYNRKLVQLVRADYSTINLDMISNGCGWIYSPLRSERTKYKVAFATANNLREPNQRLYIGFPLATGSPLIIPKNCQPAKWRRGTCTE